MLQLTNSADIWRLYAQLLSSGNSTNLSETDNERVCVCHCSNILYDLISPLYDSLNFDIAVLSLLRFSQNPSMEP